MNLEEKIPQILSFTFFYLPIAFILICGFKPIFSFKFQQVLWVSHENFSSELFCSNQVMAYYLPNWDLMMSDFYVCLLFFFCPGWILSAHTVSKFGVLQCFGCFPRASNISRTTYIKRQSLSNFIVFLEKKKKTQEAKLDLRNIIKLKNGVQSEPMTWHIRDKPFSEVRNCSKFSRWPNSILHH